METYEGLSEWIKTNRKKLGLSRTTLATLSGTSVNVIANVELGRTVKMTRAIILNLQSIFHDDKYIPKLIPIDRSISFNDEIAVDIDKHQNILPIIKTLTESDISDYDATRLHSIIKIFLSK